MIINVLITIIKLNSNEKYIQKVKTFFKASEINTQTNIITEATTYHVFYLADSLCYVYINNFMFVSFHLLIITNLLIINHSHDIHESKTTYNLHSKVLHSNSIKRFIHSFHWAKISLNGK